MSKSTPTLKNSSANNGISKRLELNPARSESEIIVLIVSASSLKVGSVTTFSLVIPCIALTSAGISISGFTSQVLLSLFPLGNIFNKEISTILSLPILIPVVSKSKKTIGLVNFKSIYKQVSFIV